MPTTACKGTLFASVEAALEFRGPGGVDVKANTEIRGGIFAVVDCLRRQPVGSDIALPEFVSEPKTTAPGRAEVNENGSKVPRNVSILWTPRPGSTAS